MAFVEKGLGEVVWSKQKEILRSLEANKRTSVPATHSPGKTHLAARMAAYWIAVHPPGTARVITTASTFRQVKSLLWPHIRSLHRLHKLMGTTTQVGWRDGDTPLADGIKPPDDKEAGVSGVHATHLLIIIDEAGGIKDSFGRSIESLMTGPHTRLVVLGNPPVSADVGWFEKISNSPLYTTIPIAAKDTPNFTGEETGWCASCPKEVDPHRVATHLIDKDYVADIAAEFGEDSIWYKARVDALFVHDSTTKTLPMDWLQLATVNDDDPHSRTNLPGPISLGCDVAADGGDEFAIARLFGWTLTMRHTSRGDTNASAPWVAAKIMEHILEAEALHTEYGIETPVRVKIDVIGVGWGVVGILQQWAGEGKFSALIIPVNVAENAGDPKKFHRQRDEMWWNLRTMVEPNRSGGGLLRLDVSNRELAQLNQPTYTRDSAAAILIESKKKMKERGVHSPDRAEALLLACYEPPGAQLGVDLSGAFAAPQENLWAG